MIRRIIIGALITLAGAGAVRAQNEGQIQVSQFPGTTVVLKLKAAETRGCSADITVACELIIAPAMSVFPQGGALAVTRPLAWICDLRTAGACGVASGTGCIVSGTVGDLQMNDGLGPPAGCAASAIKETTLAPGVILWNAVGSAAGAFFISDLPITGGLQLFLGGCAFNVAAGDAFCGANDTTTGRFVGCHTIASSGCTDSAATPNTVAFWDASKVLRSGTVPPPTVAITIADKNRTCMIVIGSDNGAALADADIGPQLKQCQIPVGATVIEIDAASDAGTPTVQIEKRVCNATPCNAGNETSSNLMSAVLTVAAGGGTSCSRVAAVTCLDGQTTASATLQNESIVPGTWFGTVSGTAGGVAARLSIAIHYTVN